MNWINSNKRRPVTDGFYQVKDSAGNIAIAHFTLNHWWSNTGHPIVYWIEPDKIISKKK